MINKILSSVTINKGCNILLGSKTIFNMNDIINNFVHKCIHVGVHRLQVFDLNVYKL